MKFKRQLFFENYYPEVIKKENFLSKKLSHSSLNKIKLQNKIYYLTAKIYSINQKNKNIILLRKYQHIQVCLDTNTIFYFKNQQYSFKNKWDRLLALGDIVQITFNAKFIKTISKQIIIKKIKYIKLIVPSLKQSPLLFIKNYRTHLNWQQFLQQVRTFFYKNKFTEINTPSLVDSTGLEENLEVFQITSKIKEKNKYLTTSPEFHLKKLLCLGWENIFEIKKCYRNDLTSALHKKEFFMLEWYRTYDDLNSIIKDLNNLLKFLIKNLKIPQLKYVPIKKYSMKELFYNHANFNLKPQSTKQDLINFLQSTKIHFNLDDSWDDLFWRIFLEKIEPYLKKELKNPIVISDFPANQKAFAHINSQGWADRIEFYFNGIEIGNGYFELNNPLEQEKRFQENIKKRKNKDKLNIPSDYHLIDRMKNAMPPSAGIAVGLERLFMALYQIKSIDEIYPHY